MEESKELQGFYKIFRAVIYVSILMEFFAYALEPEQLDFLGGVVTDIHTRIKRWMIYHDGNLVYSKVATFLLICITCVGTRNKKHLEFDARRQVLYPLLSGVLLIVQSVWLFGHSIMPCFYTLRLNTWLYMLTSIVGVVLVHIALDNISKFLKEGLLKDRFNFENESFEQCRELQENKYSVNIPMRYYYKGKFRKGWVNIVNPFRGTWVVGTPGSGKTFSIIEPFIRQHSEKGFAMVVYDYKFPTLATKLYYHYLYLEPSKQLQTMKNTWRQTFVYQLLLDFNTSNLLFGGSQKSAYLCNAFLPRRILRAFILPSRGQS